MANWQKKKLGNFIATSVFNETFRVSQNVSDKRRIFFFFFFFFNDWEHRRGIPWEKEKKGSEKNKTN